MCTLPVHRIQKFLREEYGNSWRDKLPVNPDACSVMAALSSLSSSTLPVSLSSTTGGGASGGGGATAIPAVTSTASSSSNLSTSVTQATSTIPAASVGGGGGRGGGGEGEKEESKRGRFEMLKVQGNALVKKVSKQVATTYATCKDII